MDDVCFSAFVSSASSSFEQQNPIQLKGPNDACFVSFSLGKRISREGNERERENAETERIDKKERNSLSFFLFFLLQVSRVE